MILMALAYIQPTGEGKLKIVETNLQKYQTIEKAKNVIKEWETVYKLELVK